MKLRTLIVLTIANVIYAGAFSKNWEECAMFTFAAAHTLLMLQLVEWGTKSDRK